MRFGTGNACLPLVVFLTLCAGVARSALAQDKMLTGLGGRT
jgi:hypothetical protein